MSAPAGRKPELRVLQVFARLGLGGAETWLMALLRYFDAHQHELPVRVRFDVCLTGGERGVFDDEASSLGATLFYPAYRRSRVPAFARELRAILRRGRYHAIHDHQDYMAGLHFLFGLGLLPAVRIAHIHNPFGNVAFFARSRLRRGTLLLGKSLVARLATHVTGTSRQVISDYGFDQPGFRLLQREAVHCGFEVDAFAGDRQATHREICDEFSWDRSSTVLLFVGRLNSNLNQKNPGFALEVAKACIENDPSIRLLMAGDGEEARRALTQRVEAWHLQDSIKLIGARDDVARLMLGADLLLFPSVSEGLGMVAVEAQAAGLRVLASDAVPGECQVVEGMVTFAPLATGAAAWAEEVKTLLARAPRDARACNEAVRRSSFAIEQSAARLVRIYSGS